MDYARRMIRFSALFVSLFMLFGLSSAAQDGTKPVLVELFANQNCSACPQAHRTMREVSETRDDVLVLTWVVDYWDYLGEPDPMAMPEAKARQAAYSDWLSMRAPYTPQSIYNGVKECPGPRRKQVLANIDSLAGAADSEAQLMETNGLISANLNQAPDLRLIRVEFLPAESHDTGMVNPVNAVTRLDGLQNVAHECERDCAILLQSFSTGEILAFWQPGTVN